MGKCRPFGVYLGLFRLDGRRDILDRNSKVTVKLLHCKMYIYIATFNERTLRTENRRKELFHSFDSQSITILGVIDYKTVHNESDDDIVYNQVNIYLNF